MQCFQLIQLIKWVVLNIIKHKPTIYVIFLAYLTINMDGNEF